MESKAGYDNSYWKGVFLFVADKGCKDAFLQDITCEEGTSRSMKVRDRGKAKAADTSGPVFLRNIC